VSDEAAAQVQEPIGYFVVDVRGASVGLPAAQGWTPVVPEGAEVPARKLGFEVGAHGYPLRWNRVAIGLGATFLSGRGTTTTGEEGSGSTPSPSTLTEVTTRLRSFGPQLSINFGHSLGWSYLSAGIGRTQVESDATVTAAGTPRLTTRDSGWTKTLHWGGGARWFVNDHVGVGFDVRWYKLSPIETSAAHPGAPRSSLFTAGAGVVFK
jgi:opacity protein-like surface antigen